MKPAVTHGVAVLYLICLMLAGTAARAAERFVTATLGNVASAQYQQTLKVEPGLIRFDLSTLTAGTKVQRAVLRVPFRSDYSGHAAVKLLPVGVSEKCLPTQLPSHRRLNATEAVGAWLAKAADNRGLRVVSAGRADFHAAVLEVGYLGVPSPTKRCEISSSRVAELSCPERRRAGGARLLPCRQEWQSRSPSPYWPQIQCGRLYPRV